MMEFVMGLVTAYLLTWPALIGLFVIGLFFEHNEATGWAVFTGLVAMVVGYFILGVPLLSLVWYALAYLATGFLWSFWRYKRYVEKAAQKIRDSKANPEHKDIAAHQLRPSNNLGAITGWVLIWPISLVENIAGDIITWVQELAQTLFRKIYVSIYESAVQDLVKK